MSIAPAADDRPVIILDLDNCISDDEWRIRHIDWKEPDLNERYKVYHMLARYDRPSTDWLYKAFYNAPDWPRDTLPVDCRVFVLTGRNEQYRAATEEWLSENLELRIEEVLMRGATDQSGSVDLKMTMLARLIGRAGVDPRNIIFATDDRADILEGYRSNFGIDYSRLCHHGIHSTDAESRENTPSLDPAALLRAAAATFEERNAAYGGGYRTFGRIMTAHFPDGVTLATEGDWTRIALVVWLESKMSRYTANFADGGHRDSAHDMMPYAAMLEEQTK